MKVASAPPATTKGARTREHLFASALALFHEKGYNQTTMREIAAAAGCSLGLTYRYFSGKEDLVLELYRRLAVEMDHMVQELPSAPLAERFVRTMQAKLDQLAPYRPLFTALIGPALTPGSDVAVSGGRTAEIRHHALASFATVVEGASDRPGPAQARDLATVLYAAHLGLILFWLHDPTPGQRATRELIRFTRDALALLRRLLRLPPIRALLGRLAQAIRPVFGVDGDVSSTLPS